MHDPTFGAVFKGSHYVDAPAIVPHQNVVGAPSMTVDKMVLSNPSHQLIDEPPAVSLTQSKDALHVGSTNIEREAPVPVSAD